MEERLIDIHSHIDICEDIDGVIKRAREKNILIVVAGIDHKSNATLLNLKRDYENVRICMGIYPSEAERLSEGEINKEIAFIKERAKEIVGIGEVGLDLKEGKDIQKQKNALIKLVNPAKDFHLPVIVHSRKAELETVEFLESLKYNKIIMHCFSGSMSLVKRIVENGWYLSIPTNVKKSEHFQKIVKNVSIQNLFCETDSPFLHPDKNGYNEPSNIIESYKKISEIKEISLEETTKEIWKNFKRLF